MAITSNTTNVSTDILKSEISSQTLEAPTSFTTLVTIHDRHRLRRRRQLVASNYLETGSDRLTRVLFDRLRLIVISQHRLPLGRSHVPRSSSTLAALFKTINERLSLITFFSIITKNYPDFSSNFMDKMLAIAIRFRSVKETR